MIKRSGASQAARSQWTWWALASGVALLAASQWLHTPRVEYLVFLAVATAAAIVSHRHVRGTQRWWAAVCSVSLAAVTALAIPSQQTLRRVQFDWEAWRRGASSEALANLRKALDAAVVESGRDAAAMLRIPRERTAAFEELGRLIENRDSRGVVLYRGDSALAWAGELRTAIDSVRAGTSVAATPFYLALQTTATAGDARAVVVTLVDAAPPADRVASTLAEPIAERGGLARFEFTPPSDSATNPDVMTYTLGSQRVFDVHAVPYAQGTVAQQIAERVRGRAGIAFVIALAAFIVGVWRGTRAFWERAAALAIGLACTALVPLNQYSNLTRLFDPSVYFMRTGGPLTGNAGALGLTSAIVLLGILAVLRRHAHRVSWWAAVATVFLVAGLGPFLLRDLARGVQTPLRGVDTALWLIWEIPLFLAAVSVLLTGAGAGAALLGPRRGVPPWLAPAVATVVAILGPVVWQAPGRFPWWYSIAWIFAIAALALSRRSRAVVLSASMVAALGATTLVWSRTARGRVDAGERDLASLGTTDPVSPILLRHFGNFLGENPAPITRQALLRYYVSSDLAAAGNPIVMSAWPTDSGPTAEFRTAEIPVPRIDVARVVAEARHDGNAILETVPTDTTLELVLAAPSPTGGVTAVIVAPKSRLFELDPFARLLGLDVDADVEPPYAVQLRGGLAARSDSGRVIWRRERDYLHGDWTARTGNSTAPAHIEVELRPLDALVERGALLVLLDLAIVGALWLVSVVADGGAGRWLRARRRMWGRSYRTRLTLALFAFFVIPAVAFAISSYRQLSTDATQSRSLLVTESLRGLTTVQDPSRALRDESERLQAPLFLYRAGELRDASDQLYADVAATGRFLPPEVELTLSVHAEETATEAEQVEGSRTLFGYRVLGVPDAPPTVVAAPARPAGLTLARRRRDLGVLVAFATAIGAFAAFWLSGIAARQLARPIRSLREAALSLASGARSLPLESEPSVEFRPVFAAFRRMASDLNASRTALEEAQRRTTAVLRNVASGVVAVDLDGFISLANPRAESLFERALIPGQRFAECAPADIARVVQRFLSSENEDEDFEASIDHRQLHGTLTRLSRGGAVLTLDDVSELARAQRVLAWGEMARQVAHEIKNPLTPIRLGVQHLRRARADARVDFDRVLDQNVNQILAEIDRLDEIARAFSRYGAAPEERARPVAIDVASVVREIVSLERMGQESSVAWAEEGIDVPVFAMARGDELKEVLLNILENARLADARNVSVAVRTAEGDASTHQVAIVVSDNGHGIPADVLPRVFEPHFSTRTSGSGLGLAISRQLVEGWGGTITVESAVNQGTTVSILLERASRPQLA